MKFRFEIAEEIERVENRIENLKNQREKLYSRYSIEDIELVKSINETMCNLEEKKKQLKQVFWNLIEKNGV